MPDLRKAFEVLSKEKGTRPAYATVFAIDSPTIDIRIESSYNAIRNVEVVGDIASLSVGDVVPIFWKNGRPFVVTAGASGAGTASASESDTHTHPEYATLADVEAIVARLNQGPVEGAGIDLVGNLVGLGGDTILMKHASGTPVSEFDPSDAGLDQASAAVTSPADQIEVPPCAVLTTDHTLAGCQYKFNRKIDLTGKYTLSDGTDACHLRVVRVINAAQDTIAIVGPASGKAYLRECYAYAENNAGNAYGVAVLGGGVLEVTDTEIYGRATTQKAGYGGFCDSNVQGDLYVLGARSKAFGSTDPFNL